MSAADSRSSSPLPVDAIRESFRDAAAAPSCLLLVVAPTGSGKSTRVPEWALEDTKTKVVVVEPRRVACRSLATYLAHQRGGTVGGEVGYRVRFEDQSSAATRILFVTPGVALRMMASPEIATATFVVDEFHERGWEGDLLVAHLRTRPRGLTVITSATLDVATLAPALGAKVLRAEGRSYPIEIRNLPAPSAPSHRDLDIRVAEATEDALKSSSGNILVFLPGRGEIASAERALRHAIGGDVEVLPMHGTLPPEAMRRVLAPPPSSRRRVTLATNVAETSLTLPDIRVVIDSGLMRSTVHRGGRTALSLVGAPQSSLDQRAGRAGRTAPGVCIRLFSAGYSAAAATAAEVERIELDDVLLQAASLGFEGEAFERAPWPTPPPPFAITRARARLVRSGAIDARTLVRTAKGRAVTELPVPADAAALLFDLDVQMRGTVADIVALIERDSPLFLPLRGNDDAAFASRQALLVGAQNEVEASVWALRHGDAARDRLSTNRLDEARKLSERLRRHVDAKVLRPQDDVARPRIDIDLATELARRRPQAAFVRRARADKGRRDEGAKPWGNGEDELWLDPWDLSRLGVEPPESDTHGKSDDEAAVILASRWSAKQEGLGVRGFGGMAIPCGRKALSAAGAGVEEVEAVRVVKGARGKKVVGTLRRTLAGVVLSEEETALKGGALRDAAAKLMASGNLFAGANVLVTEALHVWRIAAASLESIQPCPYASEEEAIRATLSTLGLEENADFALLSVDDFRLDLNRLANLSDEDATRLASDFPATWEYQGAKYEVVVDVRSKTVTLEATGKAAMRAKDPPSSLLPRFRGFRVDVKRASRVVRLRGT